MNKIAKMQTNSWLWKGYYPLKRMEVEYQTIIERAMDKNGIDGSWWNCFERNDPDGQIFMRLMEMYQDSKSGDFMINMFAYYDRLKEKVDAYIERKVVERGSL